MRKFLLDSIRYFMLKIRNFKRMNEHFVQKCIRLPRLQGYCVIFFLVFRSLACFFVAGILVSKRVTVFAYCVFSPFSAAELLFPTANI